MGQTILERDRELAQLRQAARDALSGRGCVVLIEGEAGIGKSSLVDAIGTVLPAGARLLVGWCDDLATRRVLGPVRDLREHVGQALPEALDSGDRGRVAEALRSELERPGPTATATVLVIEDVHWADDATLDVLRYLVRRVDTLPAVVVLTYRDELAPDHPLHQLLGLIARGSNARRLQLAPLSVEAVRRLGAQSALDPVEVHAMTAGNPFLVAELLCCDSLGLVPPSISDAVVARLSDLDAASRRAVEVLAVVPAAAERWLVEAVVPGGLAALAEAERCGVLTVSATRVAFRHELTRRAIVDSLPTVRRVEANQTVLTALLARHAQRGVDLSRILHHAARVGDEETIIHYGPLAQREAVAAGSHREAVAHGKLVLEFPSAFTDAELVEILERHAIECYTVGLGSLAAAAQEQAVRLRRRLGDSHALGVSLRWLSRMAWWAGDRARAERAGDEAVEIFTATDDEAGLALALSNRSQLLALMGRHDEAVTVGGEAIAMARTLGEPGLLSHALNNVGFASMEMGRPDGRTLLEESLHVALQAGETEHACRAYTNLAWSLINDLRYDEAIDLLRDAVELAEDAEFVGFLRYLHVTAGMAYLDRAAWETAEREAAWGLDASPHSRCPALTVTGLARSRRGETSGDDLLVEAFEVATSLREAQRLGPAGAALIEAAWLRGDASAAASRVLPWYNEVLRHGAAGIAAELGFWLRSAGHDVAIVDSEHPYACLARGEWARAADIWEKADCPYQRALALSHSPSRDDLLKALSILDGIRAEPLARIVRSRLRDLGVARIPRGPAPSTRDNPARLTGRQTEVLRLLAAGLTNAEIAARLVLSVRTVDTHVAAILGKLEAPTRREAARRAAALGLLDAAPDRTA